MPDPERGERAREAASLPRRGCGEALAQPLAAGVDAELSARLGVDEPQLADVGKLLLALIADLDRDHVVAAGELEQRAAPVERAAEVGDEHNQGALPGERACAGERLGERCRADPGVVLLAP